MMKLASTSVSFTVDRFFIFANSEPEAEIVGVWGATPPRLEIVVKSDTLSVDLDQFLVKLS